MSNSAIRSVRESVSCPLYGNTQTVYIRYMDTTDPLVECNGCENFNGSSVCQECRCIAEERFKNELSENPPWARF